MFVLMLSTYIPETQFYNSVSNLVVNSIHNPLFNNTLLHRKDNEMHLKVVTYNIFARWIKLTGYEGQLERVSRIPQAIMNDPKMGPDVDVICIQEIWCGNDSASYQGIICTNDDRSVLIDKFKSYGYV